jgi:histone H3/H4
MMYSDEDEYQSPAVVRRFGARTVKTARRRSPEQIDQAMDMRKRSLAQAPLPAPKRRRITYSVADVEKGTVAKPIAALTEFNYAPLRDTLERIETSDGLDKVKVHVVSKAGGAGADRSMDVRWSRPAIIAVASMLEMKVRRLLEAAMDAMCDNTVTLGDRAIAKAMKILGESQALRGMSGYDAEVTREALRDAAARNAKSGDGKSKKMLTKAQKAKILSDIKAKKEGDWARATMGDSSSLGRAYDIFVPRVLDYLYGETGIQRSSRESVRRILSHYAVNFLSNMIHRIHPILVNAKRCTVTVKDIDNAKDDTDRTALLGFGSIVKKRVNPDRSARAVAAAAARKTSQGVAPRGLQGVPFVPSAPGLFQPPPGVSV